MKRGLLLLLLLALVLPVLACVAAEGELRIRNRSADEIWVSVANSEPRKISGWSNWSLFYKETAILSVSYIGNYVFADAVEQTVRPGLISTVDVLPSGGAIAFANDAALAIAEVYISPTGDLDWGPNDLAGVLNPGQTTIWTVTEGTWDLKLVDADYREYYKYGIAVTANQTQSLNFYEFGREGDAKNASPDQPTNN